MYKRIRSASHPLVLSQAIKIGVTDIVQGTALFLIDGM